ncbi:MAG: cupin domain-containing protein [Alicyclobacillus sp.]|nr:cupin domain-containing protein [Alicyclobacillus sp.]
MGVNREYFRDGVAWDGTADYTPSFEHMPELASLEAAPGVVLRPLFGKDLMISYVTFAPNAVAPAHQHPQEQMSFVISGRLEFEVGDHKQLIGPGDAVTIPGNVPHAATASAEGCVCIDVFSPPREAFRELMAKQQEAGR